MRKLQSIYTIYNRRGKVDCKAKTLDFISFSYYFTITINYFYS